MEAFLEGTILYVGDRVWGNDYTLDEAVEEIAGMQGMPGAPTGVRVFTRPIPVFDPSSKKRVIK